MPVRDHHENFREFYLELAQSSTVDGGVVDIACGTGAVLLYLAERGIEVDGQTSLRKCARSQQLRLKR